MGMLKTFSLGLVVGTTAFLTAYGLYKIFKKGSGWEGASLHHKWCPRYESRNETCECHPPYIQELENQIYFINDCIALKDLLMDKDNKQRAKSEIDLSSGDGCF